MLLVMLQSAVHSCVGPMLLVKVFTAQQPVHSIILGYAAHEGLGYALTQLWGMVHGDKTSKKKETQKVLAIDSRWLAVNS